MKKQLKIKILGADNLGWSVDKDRFYTEKAIKELKFTTTRSLFDANIIYNVWYSTLFSLKNLPLRWLKGNKKVIVVATNDLEDNNQNLLKYKNLVDYWVCANEKQKKYLLTQGFVEKKIFINPFYVDEKVFKQETKTRKDLAIKLGINYSTIENKFLIGSFQRDSLGADLTQPKWHKNPEFLINVLKEVDSSKFVLLLAGPRRHFVINKCIKYKIPYVFVGDIKYIEENKDDVLENNLSHEQINLLYNLVDLYLVTSASEGGPKAIIESSLTKTMILSTAVGFAPDLLDAHSICNDKNEFVGKINEFVINNSSLEEIRKINYQKVSAINNFEAYKQRIKHIIETVSNDK